MLRRSWQGAALRCGCGREGLARRHSPRWRSIATASEESGGAARHHGGEVARSIAGKSLETARPSVPEPTAVDNAVQIAWPSGQLSRFHNIWLRDHCRCPECVHQVTRQRLLDTFKIPQTIAASKVVSAGDGLEVQWSAQGKEPGHKSHYTWSWLRKHSYAPPLELDTESKSAKVLWGSGIAKAPPEVTHEEVITSQAGLLKWLDRIDQYGFCFVTGVPVDPKATEELAKRIAHIRETHYGGFWDFTANLEHGDTAYTNLALKAHTDTTYFTDPAGLQMFHLLEFDGQGGRSLLVDGFYCASILKEIDPEAYSILSQVKIPTHSAGDADTLIQPSPNHGYPILNHDPVSGRLIQVRYNNDDRSTMSHLASDQVEPFYAALRHWNEILSDHESEYWEQLAPGTVLVFDNFRVLHGRSAYSGHRRLCGCYIGWDDYQSRLRVLRLKERGGQVDDLL